MFFTPIIILLCIPWSQHPDVNRGLWIWACLVWRRVKSIKEVKLYLQGFKWELTVPQSKEALTILKRILKPQISTLSFSCINTFDKPLSFLHPGMKFGIYYNLEKGVSLWSFPCHLAKLVIFAYDDDVRIQVYSKVGQKSLMKMQVCWWETASLWRRWGDHIVRIFGWTI